MLYVSRFSNPTLKSGEYTAVRISLGFPKWSVGYEIAGAISDLMPYGMLGKYSHEEFVVKYRERLNRIGVDHIRKELSKFEGKGKPVVLLCYEDVRVDGQTCHRTTFAEWWREQTGETVKELFDPSTPKQKAVKPANRAAKMQDQMKQLEAMQIRMF